MVAPTSLVAPVFQSLGDPALDRATLVYETLGQAVSDAINVARLSVEAMNTTVQLYGVAASITALHATIEPAIRAQAERDALFLKRETEDGFPITWSQTAVAIWGQLEAFVEDFAAVVIEFEPELLLRKDLSKINVPIGDYLHADDERHLLVVRQMQQMKSESPSGTRTRGVNQFEDMFKRLDVAGEPDRSVCDTLLELNGVRNVFAHRRGIADRRFAKDIPQFGVNVGERIKIDGARALDYGMAALVYGALVLRRYLRRKNAPQERLDALHGTIEPLSYNVNVGRQRVGARGFAKPSE